MRRRWGARRWLLVMGWALAGLVPVCAPAASWLDAGGRPNGPAREALEMLANAAQEGLVPQDYQAAELARQAEALGPADGAASPPASRAAAFEHTLDAAMRRYLHDLSAGRVEPRSLGWHIERQAPDVDAVLEAAVAGQRLAQEAAALRPRFAQYDQLRAALARYRALEADPALREPLPVPPGPAALREGEAYVGAAALRQRLVAFGDLPAGAAAAPERYDGVLADGVRRFQRRHGLEADGMLGRSTLAALNVPMGERVRQIEYAMERLRWLPDLAGRPFIGINIPMFRLWAWDPGHPEARIGMGVVVGKALDTQTPVMAEQMRYLVLRPYWDVPRSIVRHEVLPALARDPHYLQRHGMELVKGEGAQSQPVEAGGEALALLRQGALRLRQRPGPGNALGRVKFIFPNNANVYLHDTPAVALFGRARRDFSHGCVRVADPLALARWVLRDQPAWTTQRIEAEMAAGGEPRRVDLTQPIPVILFYMTALADASEPAGIRFAADLYGHDARLGAALAARQGQVGTLSQGL